MTIDKVEDLFVHAVEVSRKALDAGGEVYSADVARLLVETAPEWSKAYRIRAAQRALSGLEEEGVAVSRLDVRDTGGGIARRYYRRVKDE